MNRSQGGLCLSVADPQVDGTTLLVRPTIVPETMPFVQLRVRNSQRKVNRWYLGAEFVETPPEEVLRLFG
jgi:hypothetical protein